MNPHEHIVGYDCADDKDDAMASELLRYLVDAYPGYDWFILMRGGIVQIKVMSWSAHWGMILHYTQLESDANSRKKSVLRAAGEFLERAGKQRGANDGARVTAIEGVPLKGMMVGA